MIILEHQQSGLAVIEPFLKLIEGDTGLEAVGEITEVLMANPSYELATQYIKKDSASCALIAERYMAPAHDLEALFLLGANNPLIYSQTF